MIWKNVRCGGLEVEYLLEMQVQSPPRAKTIFSFKNWDFLEIQLKMLHGMSA